jgi:Fur family ferric uptake transcriptional regulator/Fur family zinc uptake transcriptional regulator
MRISTQLIKQSGLKRTAAREAILESLGIAGRPLTHLEILKRCKKTASLDRVTVYRTLETLLEAGLLHRIQGTDGTLRFCRHKADSSGKCAGNHIHFLCVKCSSMSCLPEQPLPWIKAPRGALIYSKQLVVQGHCAACVAKEKATGAKPRIAGSKLIK